MKGVSVSVILVNWNRCEDILENLRVLDKLRNMPIEVIVVDNGSTDDSVERLKENSSIRLLCLGTNIGPAAARNRAIELANGRYVFLLDSDAFLYAPDGLKRMVERMDRDPTIGVLACQIIKHGTNEVDQWIYSQDQETYRELEFDTYSFSAAGALVRKSAFDKIGGFWEELFMYNEEVDLSIRMIEAGYRIVYFPDAAVHHRSSPRGRLSMARYLQLQARNWIWIFYRYFPLRQGALAILLYSGAYLIKGAAQFQLMASIRGILNGVNQYDIFTRFNSKLSNEQIKHLRSLKPGRRVRLNR